MHAHCLVCPVQWSTMLPHELAGHSSGMQQVPAIEPVTGEVPLKHAAPGAEQGHAKYPPASLGKVLLGAFEHALPAPPSVKTTQPDSVVHRCVALLQRAPGLHVQLMGTPVHSLTLVRLHSLGLQTTVFTQHSPLMPAGAGVDVFSKVHWAPFAHGQESDVLPAPGKLADGPFEQGSSAWPTAPYDAHVVARDGDPQVDE